ncbi:MAG: hypothetical protein QW731_03770, partial [Thermofilaceae archaeon]
MSRDIPPKRFQLATRKLKAFLTQATLSWGERVKGVSMVRGGEPGGVAVKHAGLCSGIDSESTPPRT